MSAQPGWVAGRVHVLLAGLGDLGMSMSRSAAAELVHERVRGVSSQMGISTAAARRHHTDDALDCVARIMAISFADETPAPSSSNLPAPPPLPRPIFGRCIAGLAAAIQIRLRVRDDVEHLRSTVAQLAHALSALGQVAPKAGWEPAGAAGTGGDRTDVVMMPPGLLNRAARRAFGPGRVTPPQCHPERSEAHEPDVLVEKVGEVGPGAPSAQAHRPTCSLANDPAPRAILDLRQTLCRRRR